MHCPNCGTPATSEQQFCRACGMSLETVGKLVAQHSATPTEIQHKLSKAELEQALVQQMFRRIIWGAIILGIGVVMSVVHNNFPIGAWFKLLSTLVILSGVAVGGVGVFDAMIKGARLPAAKSGRQIGGRTETQSLPANPIPHELPSVTERTTQLIGVEDSKTNKMMDSDARQ
jgi:hypothetical protein